MNLIELIKSWVIVFVLWKETPKYFGIVVRHCKHCTYTQIKSLYSIVALKKNLVQNNFKHGWFVFSFVPDLLRYHNPKTIELAND